MIRRPPRSTLFPYTTALPISGEIRTQPRRCARKALPPLRCFCPHSRLWLVCGKTRIALVVVQDRKSTRLNSSHGYISYAVFCLKKKKHLIGSHLLVSLMSHID